MWISFLQNEEEAKAFYRRRTGGSSEGDSQKCSIAIVKVGQTDLISVKVREEIKVSAIPVEKVLDTTGAGDYFLPDFCMV